MFELTMKYTVFLVSCGLLALEIHGLSTPVVPHRSEELFPVEVDQFVDTMMRARSSEESECSGDEGTDSEGNKCESKNNTKERPGAEDQDLDNNLEGEYEKSVDKILTGVKLIMVDDVPLLYGTVFRCGKRVTFKCQYMSNNDTDDYLFYGYQTVPGQKMLRVTDAINSVVSNSLVSIFASSIDQQYRQSAENGSSIPTEEILETVQSIVDRDPDRVPEKFFCGYQVRKYMECSYDKTDEILGPELDLNEGVQRMVNSEKFRSGVIRFAKEGSSAFPALKDNLKDKIMAILLKA